MTMRPAMTVALLLMLLSATGCAGSRAMTQKVVRDFNRNLLFSTSAAYADAGRRGVRDAWPATVSGALVYEQVYFEERFIDWQGSGSRHDADFRRRFSSHRSGFVDRSR